MEGVSSSPEHGLRLAVHFWQLDKLLIQPSWVVIQGSETTHRNVQIIVFHHPMGKHIHTSTCTASSPELATLTDDPLLLLRPFDLRQHLLRDWDNTMVRSRFDAVKETSRSDHHSTSAGSEDGFDLLHSLLQERDKLLWHGLDVPRIWATNEEIVQLGTVGAGGGRDGFKISSVLNWIESCGADVMEGDFDALLGDMRGNAKAFHASQIWFGRGRQDIDRHRCVDQLEWDHQDAKL